MTHSTEYRRILNRMGYYNYQNGLIYRHVNQADGWDSHLNNCRDYILKSLELLKPDRVTVLGSGWLLELPLSEMLERTSSICLVDIIHPPDVISQAGKLKNIEIIEADVTGGLIETIWKEAGKMRIIKKLVSLDNISIPEFKPGFDPGMVISLNILTQLESLLISFLKRRSKITDEVLTGFRRNIQNKHIDFLKKNCAVLISDYAEIITNKAGITTQIPTLLAELPEGKDKKEWTWNFDQTGEDLYNSRSIMKVLALTIC